MSLQSNNNVSNTTDNLPEFCPYRGLHAFRQAHAPFFFGREAFTEQLIESTQKQPLLVVSGPSGCGKSSVVFAGLIPKLIETDNWVIISLRAGKRPFLALANALVPLSSPQLNNEDRITEIHRLADALSQGQLPLYELLERILRKKEGAKRLLLVVDQFEELYIHCPNQDTISRFQNLLLTVLENQQFRPEPIINFVFTLRADFIKQAITYPLFEKVLQKAEMRLPPITIEGIRKAIVNPAQKQNVFLEPGLPGRIIEGLGTEPSTLPLLQMVLIALWKHQSDKQLTHAAYEALGHVEGILIDHANNIYTQMDQQKQKIAERLFVQMVEPVDGDQNTLSMIHRSDLSEHDWQIVEELATTRLVITDWKPGGEESAQLTHRALINHWELLDAWLDADHIFRTWQVWLKSTIHRWQENEQDAGILLRGATLKEAEVWLKERKPYLSQIEQKFIWASLAAQQQKSARQQTLQLRWQRLVQWSAPIILIIIASLITLLAWQWNTTRNTKATADWERNRANTTLSRYLAIQADLTVAEKPDLALLLSLQAAQIADTTEARNALNTTLSYNPPLAAYLHTQTDQVRTVAFSPDGQTLASGGPNNSIILWDTTTNQPLNTPLNGHTNAIQDLTFSPDGHLLASSSADNTIILWDMETKQPLSPTLVGHSSIVWGIDFSPDGQILASASSDDTIILWNVNTGELLAPPLTNHQGTVSDLAFSPDGQLLASSSLDHTIILWDMETLQPIGPPLDLHTALVWSVAFSPDGQTIASASADNTIILWNVTTGQPIAPPLTNHSGVVWSLAFSPDGQLLASGSADNTAILWDVATAQPIASPLTIHNSRITGLAFSPDGQTLASGGNDKFIALWAVTGTSLPSKPLIGHVNEILSVAFSPDGQTLASGSADNSIRLWDVTTAQPLTTTLTDNLSPIWALAFTQDEHLVSVGQDKTIATWDLTTNEPQSPPVRGYNGAVWGMALSHDSKILAMGTAERPIVLWDTTTSQPYDAVLNGPKSPIVSFAFSTDNKILAAGGCNSGNLVERTCLEGEILLFDLTSYQAIGIPIIDHTDWVNALAFSPDNNHLISGSGDGTIIVWDVATGKALLPPLKGHDGPITSLAFSADNRFFASGSADHAIIVWDAKTATPIGPPITAHNGPIYTLAFSPDSQLLVSGSTDSTLILWDVNRISSAERVCTRANRNLSQEEWTTYLGELPYTKTCPHLPEF